METLKINCLPGDLIEAIDVDLSLLKDFKDSIRVKNLEVPSSVEVIDHEEALIAGVSEPRKVKAKGAKEEVKEEGGEAKAEGGEEKSAEGGEEKKEEGK